MPISLTMACTLRLGNCCLVAGTARRQLCNNFEVSMLSARPFTSQREADPGRAICTGCSFELMQRRFLKQILLACDSNTRRHTAASGTARGKTQLRVLGLLGLFQAACSLSGT